MADYYCKCEKCKYVDPTVRDKGYKWYCTYSGWYVDPKEIRECRHFKER